MVPNFIQKPIGAVTLLGTAIGAPYAIFETDAGTSARVVVQQWMNPATAPAAPSGFPGCDFFTGNNCGSCYSLGSGKRPSFLFRKCSVTVCR